MSRQLHNVVQPILEVGPVVGSTARRGTKWADAEPGDKLDLMVGAPEAATKYGEGEVVSIWKGRFCNIPTYAADTNHAADARTYDGLLAAMRGAYGEDFSEQEVITVVTYLRTA